MTDLFGWATTEKPRKTTDFRGCGPKGNHGNHGSRSSAEKPRRTTDLPGFHGPRSLGSQAAKSRKLDGLRKERDELRKELGEWLGIAGSRNAECQPYEAAFWAAHARVGATLERFGYPRSPAEKATILAAYDARMAAGQAAHPYRVALREAERVVKEIQKRIREINAELTEKADGRLVG